MTNKRGLLDDLAQLTQCKYLSDLRQKPENWARPCEARKLNPENYGVEEWNEAMNYITGKTYTFATPRDAWECLKSMIDMK